MANQIKEKGKWLCAGLLLLMFLVGLVVTPDYGIPTDEGQEISFCWQICGNTVNIFSQRIPL